MMLWLLVSLLAILYTIPFDVWEWLLCRLPYDSQFAFDCTGPTSRDERKCSEQGSAGPEAAAPAPRAQPQRPLRDQPQDVVLLHGLLGSRRLWRPLTASLNTTVAHRLWMPDLLGFGDSPKPRAPTCDYSRREHVSVFNESFYDRWFPDKRRVHVVGHSFGAVLALYFAAEFPARVASLTLLGMPCFPTRAEFDAHVLATPISGFWLRHPRIAATLCELFCRRRHVWSWVLPYVWPLSRYGPEIVIDYMKHTYESADLTFNNAVRCFEPQEVLSQLHSTPAGRAIPVLVMSGRNDEVAPVRCAATFASMFARSNPGARVRTRVVCGGHDFPVLHPEPVAEQLQRFLLDASR